MKADMFSPTESFGMEAGFSNPHMSPHSPNAPQGAPRGREAPGTPRPDDHRQHGQKPMYYFQPPQTYAPLQGVQWPPLTMAVPVGYNPYFGVAPYGYGMPMMPHYQPNPYMEAPTFVMPQTHLHLTDYRRMLNPYHYQTMAYHTRRFRYQQSPPAKQVTSSEVQTEPLDGTPMTSSPSSGENQTPGVFKAEDLPITPIGQPASTVQTGEESSVDMDTPPIGGFVIQTEEVTIECCAAPVELQFLGSHEAPGLLLDQVHPEVLSVGDPGEESCELEEDANHQNVVQDTMAENDLPLSPKSVQSEVHLEEQSLWSMEETLLASPEDYNGKTGVVEIPVEEHPTKDSEMVCEIEILCPTKETPHVTLEEKAKTPPKEEPTYQERQDTSFESLPAYLPSSTWLADFDRVYVCSRIPPVPRKQNQIVDRTSLEVPTRRRKLELDYGERLSVRKPKARYKPKAKMDRHSLSDHECCLTGTYNENIFTLKRERLCTRCLSKPRQALQRKSAPFQQCNRTPLSTCDTCQRLQGSVPDVRGLRRRPETEGESSENGSWRLDGPKRPPGSKRIRDKSCACDLGRQNRALALEKPHQCPHEMAMRELDANSPDQWRRTDQLYWTQRWQSEKSRKTTAANREGSRSPHLNKRTISQSQGNYRKDTQC
ncbi:uncharacterized protein LOC144209997 [Stigmatopora nigra]